MQEPTMYNQMKPQFPEHEQLKCPRCDSTNTKFCYYNNYNLSQPRHFCKNCRRYWTKGGALRNIPVGGGSRKNSKRSSNSKRQANSAPDSELPGIRKQPDSSTASAAVSASTTAAPLGVQNSLADPDPSRLYGLSADVTGSFGSLLSSNRQFGNLLEGLNTYGSGLKTVQMSGFGGNTDAERDLIPGLGQDSGLEGSNNGESYLGGGGGERTGDSSCWRGGSNGWPDLAIYTPGSSLQ